MSPTNEDFPFKDALRAQLMDTATKRIDRRRRSRRALVASVWVLLVATSGTAIFTTVQSRPAEADVLTVTADGPYRVVRLSDFSGSPVAVAKELSKAGINAEVTPAAVAPSAVGQFIVSSGVSSDDTFVPTNAADGAAEGFRIRADSTLKLNLLLGRAAQPGERYTVSSDAYRDGNLLHCSGLWGKPASETTTFAAMRNIQLSFQAPDAPSLAADPSNPKGVVTDALQTSASTVVVYLAETARSPLLLSESVGPVDCR